MSNRKPLNREVWVAAARRILVAEGIDQVKIQRLAADLRVTRGSFYWHFRDREHLLDELLALWRQTNTAAIVRTITDNRAELVDRVLALFLLWLKEREFDPGFDAAIRNWARAAPHVREALRRGDGERLAAIRTMFLEGGIGAHEAEVRAIVLYYTQIGFYAIAPIESLEERLARTAEYVLVYTGRTLDASRLRAFLACFENVTLPQKPGG